MAVSLYERKPHDVKQTSTRHKTVNIAHNKCAPPTANYGIIPTTRVEAGKSCENQALSRSRQSRNAALPVNLKYLRKRGKEEK